MQVWVVSSGLQGLLYCDDSVASEGAQGQRIRRSRTKGMAEG